jgi:hypothetical protein
LPKLEIMDLMRMRLLVGIVCFAAGLVGQGEVERADPSGEEEAAIRAKMEAREKMRGDDDANLTPEQRLERHIITGASSMCRFHASVTPPRLLPGQTGILRIVASLQGDAVIPAPAPLEVLASQQQGPVLLGGHEIRPAGLGQLAKGYLGRPVYDNYLVLEMPVTMGNEAELGKKHQVKVDMKFDLYSGTSATPIGRFLDHATAEIEVGASPVPAVGRQGRPPSAAADQGGPEQAPRPAALGNEAPPSAAPIRGTVAVPVETPVERGAQAAERAADPPPPGAGDDGLPTFLLVGGGALLLVVVLLLARRR